MKTVWVFDDLNKEIRKQDLVMLLASMKLWSIYCPQDTRVLYCSRAVGDALKTLGVPKLYHERIYLSSLPKSHIDTKIFWAYPKLRVLSQITDPITLVDHDFMAYCNLREYLNPDLVCYNYTEDARQYYPNNLNPLVRSLSYKTRWPEVSANVSFLQLPDPAFTQFYAGTSIQIMEELSTLKAPDSRFLIFAEQMVLKHLLSDQPYQCLTKEIYICREEKFGQDLDPNGIWSQKECGEKFLHYGPIKNMWNIAESKRNLDSLKQLLNV